MTIEISLDESIDYPLHCVQPSTGNFAVSHLGSLHRECVVDTSGRIIQSYDATLESGVGQLNSPCHLSVDIHDNVLVADRDKNRVQLSIPTLTYLGDMEIPGYILSNSYSLHFDKLDHWLYIGECRERGRMHILDLNNAVDQVQAKYK